MMSHTTHPNALPILLLASLTALPGCATVADMSAGMLGPDAVEKVQHRRQSKEIEAVKSAQDAGRAAELCEQGLDQNGLHLKKDLRQDICGAYASMLTPQIEAMSCEEFVTTQPTLLRYNETAQLNKASDQRASQCKAEAAAQAKAEEDARLAAEAAAHQKELAALFESKDRTLYGQICKSAEIAKQHQLSHESRRDICAEHTRLSIAQIEEAGCQGHAEVARKMYDEVEDVSGKSGASKIEDIWAKQAAQCEDWQSFFNDVARLKSNNYHEQQAFEHLLELHKEGDAPTSALIEKATKKDFFKAIPAENRSGVSYAIAGVARRDAELGTCKQFGKVLSILDDEQGKGYIIQLMVERECDGYAKQAEGMLVSDDPDDREYACDYLAKYGRRASIKKMQTLSYTDSYVVNYSYPVREACRDGYGKLQLKLDK